MCRFLSCCLGFALCPASLGAGQIFGSLTSRGAVVARAVITIRCARPFTGVTADDGSYRINVADEGRCTITVNDGRFPGSPSNVVFSYPNPSKFDFELVPNGGGFELRRR